MGKPGRLRRLHQTGWCDRAEVHRTPRRRAVVLAVIGAGVVCGGRVAATCAATSWDAWAQTGLTLRPLQLQWAVGYEVNGSPSLLAAKSLFADVALGVTRRLTIGTANSAWGLNRLGAGGGACWGGALACPGPLGAVGLDVRYRVAAPLALRVRALWRDSDPVKPAVVLGASARWAATRWTVFADPQLQVGLANRSAGNRTRVELPVWWWWQWGPGVRAETHATGWAPRVALGVRVALASDVAVWRDGWRGQIGAGAAVTVAPQWQFWAQAGLWSMFGPQNTPKLTAAGVGVTFLTRSLSERRAHGRR